MKTENLEFTICNSSNLVFVTEKLVFKIATDVFTVTVYQRNFCGYGWWVKRCSFFGFHGTAVQLLKALNVWLEVYKEEK